jgi:hypothetical protein
MDLEERSMKKLLPVVMILVFLLAACGQTPAGPSDAEMATNVAQILTSMPTSTGGPETPTNSLPTLPVIVVTPTGPTSAPTATTTLVPPTPENTATPTITNTPGPTSTPTNTLAPTATLLPSDPRGKLGKSSSTDPMDSPNKWNWPLGANDFTNIEFKNGAMIMTGLKTMSGWRLPIGPDMTNAYLEMTVRPNVTCTGRDAYGLFFRVPVYKEADRGYLYSVDCAGEFSIRKWDGKVQPDGETTVLVYWKKDKAINTGVDTNNRLGVMMKGNTLTFYMNGVQIAQVTDNSYPDGYFGVFVKPDTTKNFAIKVDEISYWLNP